MRASMSARLLAKAGELASIRDSITGMAARSCLGPPLVPEAHAARKSPAIFGWFTEGFDTADLKEAKALLDALG